MSSSTEEMITIFDSPQSACMVCQGEAFEMFALLCPKCKAVGSETYRVACSNGEPHTATFKKIMRNGPLSIEFMRFLIDLKKNPAGPAQTVWYADISWTYWAERAWAQKGI